jgi:hypothetical protein
MNKGMEKHGCCDKSIIYIHNSGDHFTVFYFFQKEKKILFVNSKNPGIKPSLENKDYTWHVSNTEIQTDRYSCGPIASEIARMLYSNYQVVERHLSVQDSKHNLVDLYDFLPKEELDQLRKSFSEEITIDYGEGKIMLKGADYRTAHFMCKLTANNHSRFFTPFTLIVCKRGLKVFLTKLLRKKSKR